jgi:integrase
VPSGFITLTALDHIYPGDTLWDTGKGAVTGFGARRQAKDRDEQTRGVSYVLKYRFQGRQRMFTIGRHGAPWTPETARKEAQRLLGRVVSGEDPADKKAAALAELTVSDWFDVYERDWSKLHKKSSTVAEDRRNFKKHIEPEIGPLKLAAVTDQHAVRIHRNRRDHPANGNRVIALLSHMFTVAVSPGFRAVPKGHPNPTAEVELYPEKARERFLSAAELARLGKALDRAEQGWQPHEAAALPDNERPARLSPEDWRAIAAIRLLLFTGARRSEILTMRWDWVDAERGVARLPDSKTGAKTIPLPAPAVEIMAALPRFKGNPHVLPGDKTGTSFVGISKPWQRIRKLAKLDDLRLHDLRHAYASLAVANNESLYLVGAVLGHRQADTTERYAHLSADPVKALADRNAARIAAMLQGGSGADVVPMRKKE